MELVRNNFSFYSPIKCLDVKLISHNDTVTLMFSCFSSGCTVVVGVGVSDWSGVEWSGAITAMWTAGAAGTY